MVESIKELKKICQKKNDNWYGRYFVRKISIYITKLLLKTDVTPNQISGLSILIGIIAGIFFVFGNYWYTLVGASVLLLSNIVDCVDGEIARYRKSASVAGKYIESLNDYIVHPFIFVCITFGLYNIFHNVFIFVLGFSIVLFSYWGTIASALVYETLTTQTSNSKKRVKEQASRVRENIFGKPSKIRHMYNRVRTPFISPYFILMILTAAALDCVLVNFCPDFSIGALFIEFGPNITISLPNIFDYKTNFNFLYIYFILFGITSPKAISTIYNYFCQMKSYQKRIE